MKSKAFVWPKKLTLELVGMEMSGIVELKTFSAFAHLKPLKTFLRKSVQLHTQTIQQLKRDEGNLSECSLLHVIMASPLSSHSPTLPTRFFLIPRMVPMMKWKSVNVKRDKMKINSRRQSYEALLQWHKAALRFVIWILIQLRVLMSQRRLKRIWPPHPS